MAINEKLENEVADLRAFKSTAKVMAASDDKSQETDDQVRHLQAQKAALQKNLAGEFLFFCYFLFSPCHLPN